MGDPLFLASFNHQAGGGSQIQVTPFLPANPSSPWVVAGLRYSCDGGGPGVLRVTNGGHAVTVVSISLTYGGGTYTAAGTSCPVPSGNAVISVTSLGSLPGSQGSQYEGYLVVSDGTRLPFSGSWA